MAFSESTQGSHLLENAGDGVGRVAIPKLLGEWMFGLHCKVLHGSIKRHLELRRLGLITHITSRGEMRPRKEELKSQVADVPCIGCCVMQMW
jgi:hypothetical protein